MALEPSLEGKVDVTQAPVGQREPLGLRKGCTENPRCGREWHQEDLAGGAGEASRDQHGETGMSQWAEGSQGTRKREKDTIGQGMGILFMILQKSESV